MQSEPRRIRARIAQLSARGVDSGRIGQTALSTWHDVAAALSPVIGELGVAALYKRSLHLIRAEYPWLAAAQDGKIGPDVFGELQVVLSQQTRSEAVAANGALLQSFYDLLTRLVGEALTERLLRSVWENPSSGPAVQDSTP